MTSNMFGWAALVVLVAAVGTSGYYRRRARVASETIPRLREGGLFLTLRLLVALFLVCPVLLYAVAPTWMAWASVDLPDWMRWVGLILGLSTIPAVSWVLRSLGQNVSETVLTKRRHALVTAGPYRWVRHPLYTTGVALGASMGLMNASWFLLVVGALAAVLVRVVVIPLEERELISKFGERYQAYMRGTGRFLPLVGGVRL